MTWCRAMGKSGENFVGGGKYGRRHHAETAIAIINQPVTGFAAQPGLAVGQQYLEWRGHLQRKDAVRQAQVGSGFPGAGGGHWPVLVAKMHARYPPALARNAGQDRIAGLGVHQPLGRLHGAAFGSELYLHLALELARSDMARVSAERAGEAALPARAK